MKPFRWDLTLRRSWFRISYASFSALKPLGTGWGNPEVGRKKEEFRQPSKLGEEKARGGKERLHDIKTHSLIRMRNRPTAWTSKRLLKLNSTLKVFWLETISRFCYFLQTLLFVGYLTRLKKAPLRLKRQAREPSDPRVTSTRSAFDLLAGRWCLGLFFPSSSSSRLGPLLRCSVGIWFIRPHYT